MAARPQTAVAYLGQQALSGIGVGPLLEEAVRLAAELLDVEHVAVWELLAAEGSFLLRAGTGWPDGQVGTARLPSGPGFQPGYTLRAGAPILVRDRASEQRFAPTHLCVEQGLVASLTVPIGEADRSFGVLGAHAPGPRVFTEDEVQLLQALANLLATEVLRFRSERALRESEERFRLMVEASEEVFFYEHGADHRITYLSPSVERVLGYAPEELVGKRYDVLLWDSASEKVATRQTKLALDTGIRTDAYEVRSTHKDGRMVVLEIMERPVPDPAGAEGIQGFCRDVTERKRAEEALGRRLEAEEALQRLSSTLVSAAEPDLEEALAVLGQLVDVSRAYIFLLRDGGASMDNTDEWCAPGVQPQKESLQGMAAEAFPWWMENLRQGKALRIPDVSSLPPEASIEREILEVQNIRSALAVPLTGRDQELLGYVGFDDTEGTREWTEDDVRALRVASDIISGILQRRDAEQSLRRSEEYFRALIERQGDMVAVIGPDGTASYASPSYRRSLGYDPDELVGRNLLDLVHPEDRPMVENRLARLLIDSEREDWARLRVRDSKGRYRTHVISGRNLLDVKAVRGIVVTGSDVTEWEQTEERLRLLSRAVEQSPVSIVITDAEGDIVYVNPKFAEVTGYPEEEIIGRNPRILNSGRHDAAFYERLWETITSAREWRGEMENRRKNGDIFREAVSISPVLNPYGEITHFIAVKEDITERHLLQEKYQQSQKMEAVGRLAGGVAHDFNNLLTAINGNAEFLLMDLPLESPLREDVLQIQRAAKRATDLTGQLLAFSRQQALDETVLDLRQVVANIEPMLRRLIPESIQIRRHSPKEVVAVKADVGQMEQVLLNLAVNARDAMGENGVLTFTVDTLDMSEAEVRRIPWHAAPGSYARLSVSDTGAGMSADVMSHIFDPFFTTKPKGKGTGLGLSTVFGIVKQSGGHIFVESEPGEGTTFRILLPTVAAELPPSEKVENRAVNVMTAGGTILVVEDDASVRRLAKRILERAGYQVLEASNGKDALEVAATRASELDLVLTDVVMPEMGGVRLGRLLRERHPGLKVIFASGYSEEGLPAEINGETVALLRKPFTPEELLGLIGKTISD